MRWSAVIQPRVLIVENEEDQLQLIKETLEGISENRRKSFGVDKFLPNLARTVDEAEQYFANSNGTPYDLLLLDLGIPLKRVGDPDPPEHGQKLLRKVRKTGRAKEVIVISVFSEVDNVGKAFRNGAMDFVPKPYTAKVLQAQIMECWKRLLNKESIRLLGEDRIKTLVPYAEKGLAYRFTKSFSNLVRTVAHSSEDIERYMHERYHLDRQKDAHDYFFVCLNSQNESIMKEKQEWAALNAPLQPEDENSQAVALTTLLREVHHSLLPCLVVKHMIIDLVDDGTTEVLTFEDDVKAVLREIIAGAATKIQDFDHAEHLIEIESASADGQVKVSFRDDLEPITLEDAKQINAGSSISPQRRFDREWGLSVLQHIAMRGGGRLEIEPKSDGNVINYFVPSAM